MTITQDETLAFADAVAGATAEHWGDATSAPSGDLAALWCVGTQLGWFELGSVDALSAVVAATRRLGRAACPLPLMDGYVASRLLAHEDKLRAGIEDGSVRVLVVAADANGEAAALQFLDAGDVATHVLVVPADGGSATLRPVLSATALPGLAVPAWTRVELGEPTATVEVSPDAADECAVLVRLALAARALAAAERVHELAVEHAKVRVQFAKPIGSFGGRTEGYGVRDGSGCEASPISRCRPVTMA